MKALRLAALLALGLGAASLAGAADRANPAPEEIIFPRTTAESAAADAAAGRSAAFAPGPMPATGGLASTAGYVVTFGLLLGGAWLLLKRGTFKRAFHKSEGRLQVLETKMLGNRQFLLVVEYDDAKLLLGVCPGRIDYLTPLAGHPLSTGATGVTVAEVDEDGALPFVPKGAAP
jgi:flagellar protein FliO/FliZ